MNKPCIDLYGNPCEDKYEENAYRRKTQDEYVLQGNYGYGWEDLTAEASRKEILARRREYQENEPGTPLKIVVRRIPLLENPVDIGFWTGLAAIGGLILIMATRKKKKPAATAANLTAAKGLAQQNTP